MKSSFEQNSGTYRLVRDFNIPNLSLPPEEIKIRLGKWGLLHKDYLLKTIKFFLQPLLLKANCGNISRILIFRHSKCLILLLNR